MYLVGKSEDRDMIPWDLCVKEKVTREDLAKTKEEESFQVINLRTLEYFDPEKNDWMKIKTK